MFWSDRKPVNGKVEINLGRLCNLECVFCMSSGSRNMGGDWMENYEAAVREMQSLRTFGSEVGFLGGEPTAHPRIVDLIKAAAKMGYKNVSLCTNGVLCSDMKAARELVEAGLTRVTLSIHSHRADIEDVLTNRENSFRRKELSAKNFADLYEKGWLQNPPAINLVVHKKNYRSLKDFLDYFSERGIREFRFNGLRPEGRGREARAYFVRYSTAAGHILEAVLHGWQRGFRVTCGGFPPCVWPRTVHARQDVVKRLWADRSEVARMVSEHSPCTEPGRFSWDDMRCEALKTKPRSCWKCRLTDLCEGIWISYASIHGLREFRPME